MSPFPDDRPKADTGLIGSPTAARLPELPDGANSPSVGEAISYARIDNALKIWASTASGPFVCPIDDRTTVDQARAILNADPRISELSRAAGIERYLDAALTKSTDPELQEQYARNAVRVERLVRFYDVICSKAGDKDLAALLATKLESSGVTAALVSAPYDENFEARFQAALLPLYVKEQLDLETDARMAVVRKTGDAAGLVPAVLERELSGQALMLFAGAASIGLINDFPAWTNRNGWNGPGLDLAYAFNGGAYDLPWSSAVLSQQLTRPQLKDFESLVKELALWSAYETGRDYDTVRRAAFQLQICKAFPALDSSREKLQSELTIFGRDPTQRGSDWFGTTQTEKTTRSAAERLASSLHFACEEGNLGEMLLAFHAFERRANPTRATSSHVSLDTVTSTLRGLAQRGITHETAARNPSQAMAAAAVMLLYVNQQTIPAGYYIHADTVADPATGFRFSKIAAGPVVAQRFVRGPDGKEFDQVVVDAKHGTYGYDMQGAIDIPIRITFIHRQYDHNGSLLAQWNGGHTDLTHEFRARFCTVFLPDVLELAETLKVSPRRLFDVIADHEADHGLMRHDPDFAAITPVDWVTRYRDIIARDAPHLLPDLTFELNDLDRQSAHSWIMSTMLEMSAIIREAARDPEAHRLMRRHFDDGGVPLAYKAPCELIAVATQRDGVEAGLNSLYSELFGKPLPVLDDQWLVLPSNRHRIPT